MSCINLTLFKHLYIYLLYFVLYYFTQIVKPDGLLSEDELTPLIFEAKTSSQNISSQDPLIGKGQDFVFRLKNQT